MVNTLVMLVGLPMSGKSFSEKFILRDFYKGGEITTLSSDYFVDEIANVLNMNYDDVWDTVKNLAAKALDNKINEVLARTTDVLNRHEQFVIWDQTNLTKNSRAKKLAKFPDTWKKIAIYFPNPGAVDLALRKKFRKADGKVVPENVLETMNNSLELPDNLEPFDEIYDFNSRLNSFSLVYKKSV